MYKCDRLELQMEGLVVIRHQVLWDFWSGEVICSVQPLVMQLILILLRFHNVSLKYYNKNTSYTMKDWEQEGTSTAIIDKVWPAQTCDHDESVMHAWDKALTLSRKHGPFQALHVSVCCVDVVGDKCGKAMPTGLSHQRWEEMEV